MAHSCDRWLLPDHVCLPGLIGSAIPISDDTFSRTIQDGCPRKSEGLPKPDYLKMQARLIEMGQRIRECVADVIASLPLIIYEGGGKV